MATSGTTTYSVDRDTIITEALKLIEVLEEGTSANVDQINDAVDPLQMMLKSFTAQGLHLWKRTSISIPTLTAGKATYTIGPSGADITADKPVRLLTVTIKDGNGNEIPMTRLSLQEYEQLSNKSTSGKPIQYYFNPERLISSFTVWPVADSNSAANDSIDIVAQTHIEDVTNGNEEVDVPAEWYEVIKYQLAVRLAPMYNYPLESRLLLRKEAKELLDNLLDWDSEDSSIYFQPDLTRHG